MAEEIISTLGYDHDLLSQDCCYPSNVLCQINLPCDEDLCVSCFYLNLRSSVGQTVKKIIFRE